MTLLFLACTMLSSFMEGAGGLVSTRVRGGVNSTATIIPADNITGFLSSDVIVIGDEEIAYGDVETTPMQFIDCERGYNGTEANTHIDGTKIYSSELSPINSALGFNVASTATTAGAFALVMIPYKFFTKSVPKMIMFDYSFFTGQLAYLQIFFQALGVGFALMMAFWVINALTGVIRP
ncbi:hypothetical protein KKE60_06500 [Patescibacteria group bacterium]|nr:hypothetical protein [Patescibacteria group bacterium]